MKKPVVSRYTRIIAASLLAAVVLAPGTIALAGGTLYWDNDTAGMSGNPPATGGSAANASWSVGSNWWTGTAYQAWADNSVADFRMAGGTALTVAVAANVTADGLVFSANTWTLANSGGAVLTLNNLTPNITFTGTAGNPVIS